MKAIKEYYSYCLGACSSEKYIIDQNEIEFPNTARTNLSFRMLDYDSTISTMSNNKSNNFKYNVQNSYGSSKDMFTNEIEGMSQGIHLRHGSIRRTAYRNDDFIQVLDDFLFNIPNGYSNEKVNSCRNNLKPHLITIEDTFNIIKTKEIKNGMTKAYMKDINSLQNENSSIEPKRKDGQKKNHGRNNKLGKEKKEWTRKKKGKKKEGRNLCLQKEDLMFQNGNS